MRDRPFLYLSVFVLASSVATFWISSRLDVFGWLYDAIRRSGSSYLDDVILLIVNVTVGLTLALMIRSNQLAKALGEKEVAEQRAREFANYDSLTGLLNRKGFESVVVEMSQSGTPKGNLVFLSMNLNSFRGINDLHGHTIGDDVLQQAGQRLAEIIGEKTVARLGGDEFACVLQCDADQAERIARRVIHRVSAFMQIGQLKSNVGVSIGLSLVPNSRYMDGLKNASRALRLAKKNGRNQLVWYDADLDTRAKDLAQLEADLKRAVVAGEIVPYFQTVHCLETGEVESLEVLSRWHHPDRGTIGPDVFIPLAEDIGLISDLGWIVMERACRDAVAIDRNLKLNINVSAFQVLDRQTKGRMADILGRTGFPPENLVLEITEAALMTDFDEASVIIKRLQDFGLRVALDDFGAGNSSLSAIRRLPIDILKVDKTLVRHAHETKRNQQILSGVLSMANGLGVIVAAEGIETADELAFLQSIGCSLGQGYHFSKPMVASEVMWHLDPEGRAPRPEAQALSA